MARAVRRTPSHRPRSNLSGREGESNGGASLRNGAHLLEPCSVRKSAQSLIARGGGGGGAPQHSN